MGRTLEEKKAIVTDLKGLLQESQLALVIDYTGLTVAEITDLRDRLRSTGAICRITKNTLMRTAVEGDNTWQPMTEFLKDASAFILIKDDLGNAIKAYQAFKKDTKKTELRGGVMEGKALYSDELTAITELPSKEELIAQIAGALKATSTKLAVGLNAVPTKLAVGLKEVPASLNRSIKAISQKEE